ncbi:hypothetical protein P4T79_08015 [Bacillus mojavensis]|uniref:hypothetical protein n=1 Tax=Bacillus mojavensis TaxID=72360 RepID=UPI002DBE15C5|nr:hypothetical protein [Bacillus mojavensis]MEC1622117.1 hypothetical protein [Bacillus mojavensis]MEC1660450.1 hypothetical protein [Bacillus mojavensis]MEC1734065.1 hypothetical protein [Bacillus mojavensis]MED1006546.1 hypothetical protein [Bacillus mojavensis]
MEKYYHLCRQHQGKVARITERNGRVHVGRITRVTNSKVFIAPVTSGGPRGGFGYGYWGGYGYGYGYGAAYGIGLGLIAGVALAGLFFF